MKQRLRKLADLLSRHAPADGTTETAVPNLSVIRRSAPSRPVSGVYSPLLCLVAQGAKRVACRSGHLDLREGEMMLTSAELPASGQAIEATEERPFLAFSLVLDLAVAGEIAASLTADTLATGETPPLRRFDADAPTHDAIRRLTELLDQPAHIPALAPLITREIIYRVLIDPASAALRRQLAGGRTVMAIRSVAAWMKDHPAHDASVAGLAAMAGMSVSVFHRRFVEVTSLTPMQFKQQMRLHEARRLMLTRAEDAAGASRRVGYRSSSQFSREYKRLYGRSPARDVADPAKLDRA